jgi:hypothetical protein
MKRALLVLLAFFTVMGVYAQKIELSFQANTGAYHYSGASATAVSFFNQGGATPESYYTSNPYGSKGGFSYGAGVQAQHVSTGGFITGLQAGYDILRSKTDINSVHPFVLYDPNYQTLAAIDYSIPAKGQTYLQNQSINLSPYVGYRFKLKKIKFDLMPGMDFAFNLSSKEKGTATSDGGTVYKTNIKQPDAPTDIRLKFGIAASYKKWGITAGYAHGITNLDSSANSLNKNYTGDNGHTLHSELLRFGVTCRIL